MGLFKNLMEGLGLYEPPPEYPGPTPQEQALTETQLEILQTMLEEWQAGQEPSELELAGERVGLLALERQEKAMRGELDLPVGFEERKEEAMTKLELKLSMEGKGVGSSAWNDAMAEFESDWAMSADAIRRGEITGLTGVSGLQQEYAFRREEAPFARGGGLLGGYGGLSGYYSGERGLQYSASLMEASEWNRMMRSMGETAGTMWSMGGPSEQQSYTGQQSYGGYGGGGSYGSYYGGGGGGYGYGGYR